MDKRSHVEMGEGQKGGDGVRLIDKDALKEAIQGAINIMESKGISMISASVPLAIIKSAPTIPAIPIDWLDAKQTEAYKAVYYCKGSAERNAEIMRSIVVVMELWKERENAVD